MMYTPNKENLTQQTALKSTYHFCNDQSKPVFKTKEIVHSNKTIIFYPYNVNLSTGEVRPKRIKCIEFRGWAKVEELPKIIKKSPSYGFNFISSTQLLNVLYKKFPDLEKVSILLNGQSRFSQKTITLTWADFSSIVKNLKKEKTTYELGRKHLVYDILADLTGRVDRLPRTLKTGELEEYLSRFSSFDKISIQDIDAFTQIFSDLPITKITATTHLIKTKEKIDIIYIDDIITNFEKLMTTSGDDEEAWQKYFQEHTWTLNHLFPYEVILSKGKAYVGGKTMENEDGRIVDFLFQSGFKDNFALLEIKTPKSRLLKNSPYREPSVFPISDDLSGGVNQCLDQKDTFLKTFGQTTKSLDPKTVLVIGQKKGLTTNQAECFELYRSNQKNVDIVTFDELYSKLLGLYEVLTGKKRK